MAEKEIDLSGQFLWRKVLYATLKEELTPDVSTIDVSTCHVCADCAKLIAAALTDPESQVTRLNLSMCRMEVPTTILLMQVIPQTNVEHLILDSNVLTVEACQVIGEMLAENPSLVSLSMKKCDMPADGCIEIAKQLPKNSNLKLLWLDQNCIFDRGAQALAITIPHSGIVGFSIADNQIWNHGTELILAENMKNRNLVSLNLAYNIVDLAHLARFLIDSPSIKNISISGCKVDQSKLLPFFEELKHTKIEMLSMQALNYNILPVTWPKVADMIWTNTACFTAFMETLQACGTLQSLRLGFLTLTQIMQLKEMFESGQITRPIELELADFGRSENTWTINFPDFTILSPTTEFRWAERNIGSDAAYIQSFYSAAKCVDEDVPLETLDLHDIDLTDAEFAEVFESCEEISISSLDLSCNRFGDKSVESLTSLCMNANLVELNILETKMTDAGIGTFLQAFDDDYEKVPSVLKFSFATDNYAGDACHEFAEALGSLIANNSPLEELVVEGPVTAVDLCAMFESLSGNSTFRSLVINQVVPEEMKIRPKINPAIQKTYYDMVAALHRALNVRGSKSVFSEFKFPLLTTVYMFDDDIIDLWQDVENNLENNSRK